MKQPELNSAAPIPKLPYSTPTLTRFGSVAQLTRGSTGSRVDSGSKTPSLPPPIIRH